MERTDAKGFITDFNRTYRKKTELRRICGHRLYGDGDSSEDRGAESTGGGKNDENDSNSDSDGAEGADADEDAEIGAGAPVPEYDEDGLRYFQVGRRISLPVSLIEERRYSYVSDTVVGALCEGEKTFLAERLSVSADEDGIPTVEKDVTDIVEASEDHVTEPNHVLLPRTEECGEAVSRWEKEGRLRRLGDTSYLKGIEGDEEGETETDCWLHRYDPTPDARDAFVIDDGRVTVVQKVGGEAEPPTDLIYVVGYEDLNDDVPLTVYFGEDRRAGDGTYEEFFDIVYRVVLSEPVVNEGGVCRLHPS